MIPVLSNVAGAAQAQRHNAFNQNKADQTAKDAAARAVRDRLMLGLVDAGVNAAMTFGGKAYDEATTGARDAQRLKSDLDQRERANVLDLADRNIDQLGYTPKSPTPAPSYSDGSTGSAMDDRSSARGRGGINGAGDVARIMTEQGGRETAPADVVDPYAALSPLQKAAQTTLERSRQAAKESAAAQARAAAQQRTDALAKEEEGYRLESYKAIGGLQTATQQRYGAKGRPANAPQFGVQPTVDERGIVRPKFTEPKAAPMPSGGGGAGRATPALIGALAEPVELIAAREGRKGDPTTGSLTRTIAARGEWAQAAIKNPAKYGLTPAEVAKVAQGFRIAQANVNDPSKVDVVATAIATMDEARKASIARVGPLIAQVGDTLGTSPADAARVQQSDADRETARRRQAAADAERAAKTEKGTSTARADADVIKSQAALEARNTAKRDIDEEFDGLDTVGQRFTKALAQQAYATGGAPPAGVDPREWARFVELGKDARAVFAAKIAKAKALEAPLPTPTPTAGAGTLPPNVAAPGLFPSQRAAPAVDLSTPEGIRAALSAGLINREQAVAAARKLNPEVD